MPSGLLVSNAVKGVAGTALGWSVQWGLAGGLREILATELPAPSMLPLAHGLVVGMALLAGFVLPQLLRLGGVSTLRVLRREFELTEPVSGSAWVLGLAALLGLIFWIAADLRLGVLVAAGFALALGVFALAAWGALSVSVGFSTLKAKVPWAPAFLAPIAARVRQEASLPVAAAWGIDTPQLAENSVANGQLDLVMVGRAHLANPHWPMHAARALGVERPTWVLPAPYAHWLERYAGA